MIVTIRDNRDYSRVLLHSYYTTIKRLGGPRKVRPLINGYWALWETSSGRHGVCAPVVAIAADAVQVAGLANRYAKNTSGG